MLRTPLDLRFLNSSDGSQNILASPAVLTSCILLPGGARLLTGLASQVGVRDPGDPAVGHVGSACGKLYKSYTPSAGPPSARAPALARERARSSLVELTNDEEDDGLGHRLARSALATSKLGAYKALVAFSVLGADASAAGSERNFSLAGSIMRKTRPALLSQHMEMRCFIYDTVKLHSKDLNDVPILKKENADRFRADMPLAGPQEQQREAASAFDDDSWGEVVSALGLCGSAWEGNVHVVMIRCLVRREHSWAPKHGDSFC